MQAYTMLQALSKLGVRTASFCGGIFDNPSGKERIPNFDVQLQSDNNHPVRANIDTGRKSFSLQPFRIPSATSSSRAFTAHGGTTSPRANPRSFSFTT